MTDEETRALYDQMFGDTTDDEVDTTDAGDEVDTTDAVDEDSFFAGGFGQAVDDGGFGDGDGTGTAHDDTLQEVTDWQEHEDNYVPGPVAPPDHHDDHSDTEYEARPVYHMDEFHRHDPTPAPTHIPQNIKVI